MIAKFVKDRVSDCLFWTLWAAAIAYVLVGWN